MKKEKIKIIYEDKYLIVVDKPYGLLSISNNKDSINTMYHKVYEYLKQKNKNNKIFIVHRLDRDTSGLMIFAKTEESKIFLQDNWNSFKREYVALVSGKTKPKDRIEVYLKETSTLFTYVSKDETGKFAVTEYNTIKQTNKYSLISVSILTGRKNQIRVSLSYLGYPIIGDKKYGNGKNNINRLALHATRLFIIHPKTKEELEFVSKYPKNFDLF